MLKKYLVYHQYTIITNLYLKLRQSMSFFNSYFTGQCTPLVNKSQLPTRFSTHTNSVLTSIDFLVEQVSNIKKLDPNKAHGHGKIRIHVCSINRPLATILTTI